MSAVPKPVRLSPAEYLALERASTEKHDYLAGEVFAMAGASFVHGLIVRNIVAAYYNQFRGGPCRAVGSDLRVKAIDPSFYAYPDVVVLSGDPKFEDGERDTLLNPAVVVEVLSPSTERYDRGLKFAQYRRIASLQEYVLVAQDEPRVERFLRADNSWTLREHTQINDVLALESVPLRVSLREVYLDVSFDGGS
jgi:Uma2 family endonuclease